MKKIILVLTLLLFGCATNDYQLYLDAQKSISRDLTVKEAAHIQALIELTKSANPEDRKLAIIQLQQILQNSKQVIIEPPKRNLFGF
jgi:hypothetical protein